MGLMTLRSLSPQARHRQLRRVSALQVGIHVGAPELRPARQPGLDFGDGEPPELPESEERALTEAQRAARLHDRERAILLGKLLADHKRALRRVADIRARLEAALG